MLQEPCSFNTVLDAPVDACGLGHDVWGLLMAEHVLGAALPSSDIVSGPVETLTGAPVKLAVSDAGAITVNDTNVTGADMAPSNGIVHHVINTVMLPRTTTNPTAAVAAATTAALVDAVAVDPTEAADIVSGPVETLTGAPVKLAVSDAGAITVNDTNVTGADMAPSNGIVHHVINTVMLPRTATNPTAAVAAATTAAPVDPTDAVAVDPTEAAPAEPVMSLPATVVVDPLAAL